MRTCVVAAITALIGCGGGNSAPVVPGAMLADATAPASTSCYQGVSRGAGQQVRTLVRRAVDPAARQIVEDVVHDDAGGLKRFHVVLTVEGARFTMTEAGTGVTGTGTLVGEPWRWTSWTSTSRRPGADAGIEIESHDQLTPTGKTARKQIRQAGAVIATIDDELTTLDCAGWDAAAAQLAVPVLDDALCDRACRQFATLKFAAAAEAALAALPAAARDEARRTKAAELAAQLDAGAPACIAQCRAANNATQTACIARATSVDQLTACE